MIAYRDFRPEALGWLGHAREVPGRFERALAEANEWLALESIDVLSVETVGYRVSSFESPSIRIWYRSASLKPKSTPEV